MILRKNAFSALMFIWIVLSFGIATAEGGNPGKKPNFLLITIDTLRADHLSCYGYHRKTSPNIDKLADEGVLFERCSSNIPLTGPSHCTMLTSLYPHEHGSIRNGVPVNEDALSIATILQQSGYNTAAFVSSWTLKADLTGAFKGFSVYDDKVDSQYSLINNERIAENTTALVLDWMNKASGEPFFLWVHLFDPHDPYNAHEGFANLPRNENADSSKGQVVHLNRKKQELYDQEIAYTDKHIGMILEKLESKGVTDNTYVILTADHGESFGEHSYTGHGRKVYEAGIHVPLVIRGNGIKEGGILGNRVQLLDIAPTVASLAGIEVPAEFGGIDLSPLVKGKGEIPERDIYFMTYPGAVGHLPKWLKSIIVSNKPSQPLKLGVKKKGMKYILTPDTRDLEVYDLILDRFEVKNLSSGKPEYRKLKSELLDWFRESRKTTGKSKMGKEDKEMLKSLGYIN